VEYRIEARLDESAGALSGRARLYYRNNSPHTMEEFHLQLGGGPGARPLTRSLSAGGRPVQEFEFRYPLAPDSSVVAFDLPTPLAPGATLILDHLWDVGLPGAGGGDRGQGPDGPAGRRFDAVGWYPRIPVFGPSGWRIDASSGTAGEFAAYDVTIELRSDQVVGATGVPVAGDPGWEGAAVPGTGPPNYQREWYGSLVGPPCIERDGQRLCGVFPARRVGEEEALGLLERAPPPAGWKRVRWLAEDVHDFAWSAAPGFAYEQGRAGGVTLHALYDAGRASDWAGGQAVRLAASAFHWLGPMFGAYPYPHVTLVQGATTGRAALPMLLVSDSATPHAVVEAVARLYLQGVFASDDRGPGWFDDALPGFLADWFAEESGAGEIDFWSAQESELVLELLGGTDPVLGGPGGRAVETQAPGAATRLDVVLWRLRQSVGADPLRAVLRAYVDRVRPRDARLPGIEQVAREVLGAEVDGFFAQWLHTTGLLDYSMEGVTLTATPGGGYLVHLDVMRRGERRSAVPVRLYGAGGEVRDTVLDGWAGRALHVLQTDFAPEHVELDPDGLEFDWNVRNNAWSVVRFRNPALELALDRPLQPLPTLRDSWRRIPVLVFPLVWRNEAGGVVAGLQSRSVQLGFLHETLWRVGLPAVPVLRGDGLAAGFDPGSVYGRVQNPLVTSRPWLGTSFEGFLGEGLGFAGWMRETGYRTPVPSERSRALRVFASSFWAYGPEYFVEGRWTPERKFGLVTGAGASLRPGGDGPFELDLALDAGFDSKNHRWARAAFTAEVEAGDRAGWQLRARSFAGVAAGWSDAADEGGVGAAVPREHLFFLSGGGPLAALANPWLRSRGAPLAEAGRTPGGGALRGYHAGVGLPALATLNVEGLVPPVGFLSGAGWSVRPLAFAGAGMGAELPGRFHPTVLSAPSEVAGGPYWSVGAGVEIGRRGAPFGFKVELPVLLSHPELAANGRDAGAAIRWSVSLY